MNYHGWPERSVEYECNVCGHVGWSRHPWINARYDREAAP